MAFKTFELVGFKMAQFDESNGTFKILDYYITFQQYVAEDYIWNTIFNAYKLDR